MRLDPRFADRLQQRYPTSEERMGKEGTVAVRVTIGADGRVTAVQEVRATSDAFFRATQQHARQPAAILSSNGGWETG